jgi:predicted membrane-bound spermidine synthase
MGAFTGTALASLVIFAPPMMVLAAACPFVVRLLADSGGVGSASGKVYALSTIGGIAGILATSFLLVPYDGTQKTLEAICLVTAATGLAGLAGHLRRASLAFGAILALAWIGPGPSWPPGTLWAADSPYNLVRVVRDGDLLVLKLNSDSGVHTIRNERTGWTGHYYDDFSLGPLLVPAKSLLVLGLGGGGSIASTRITAPDVDIDAVEIDPRVVEAAVRFFGVRQSERLRIHVADARPWLKGHPGRYDIVHVDLYQGGPYVPFYLLTREFFEDVRGHMSGDGLLMMNLLDVGRQKELLLSTVATLRKVFASVLVLPAGFGNHLIFAFSKDTPLPSVRERLGAFRGNPLVESRGRRAAIQIASSNVPMGTPEFTDDFAPVEEMTGRMLRESGSRWP